MGVWSLAVKIIDKHFGFTDSTYVSMPRDSNEQWPMTIQSLDVCDSDNRFYCKQVYCPEDLWLKEYAHSVN